MATTGSNFGQSANRRREEALTNGSWSTGIASSETTLVEPIQHAESVCANCQSLLTQPARDPETQIGVGLTDPQHVIELSMSMVSDAARYGCVVCKLVGAAQITIGQFTTASDQLGGFKLSLCWFSSLSRFDRIDVLPIDTMGNMLSWHGHLNGVRLIPEDGTISNLFLDLPVEELTINKGKRRNRLSEPIAYTLATMLDSGDTVCRGQPTLTGWLPTRLIEVGLSNDSQQPRLIVTSEIEGRSNASYITLSHRWASAQVVKLETTNIKDFKERIPVESLSNTFVDAIEVTKKLRVPYLWIDSLCIMQDSSDDWKAESADMGRIYGNCVCNIASPGSSDTGGGLFQSRDPHLVTPSEVHIRYEGHDQVYKAILYDLWGKWIARSTLNRRGWVLQERMLSPRTLHFASQLFWECRMLQACETYPEGMPGDDSSFTEVEGSKLPMSLKTWYNDYQGIMFWSNVVQTFGRCSLTKPEDRLIAIAGVAKSLQPLLRDEYLAGLWKKDFPYNLVWSLFNVEGELQLPRGYRCPSWSWAHLDYHSALIEDLLVPADCRVRPLVTVLEVRVEPLTSDTFTDLRGGYLRLTGRIGRIFSFSDQHREGEWIDGHWSFEAHMDVGSRSVDDESLFALPLFIRTQNPGLDWPEIVECLLLERLKPDAFDFRRAGLLSISLDLEDRLPREILWIVEHANSNLYAGDLVPLTIH